MQFVVKILKGPGQLIFRINIGDGTTSNGGVAVVGAPRQDFVAVGGSVESVGGTDNKEITLSSSTSCGNDPLCTSSPSLSNTDDMCVRC